MTDYSNDDLLTLYSDADFYDQEFSDRNFELPFYQDLCEGKELVHELACGTGRLTIPLYKQGISISGSDISPAMIRRAQEKSSVENLDITFICADAKDLQGSYDLVFIATNAFQHLLDSKLAAQVINAARESLIEGGRLLIDIQMPRLDVLSLQENVPRSYKSFQHQGETIVATQCSNYDAALQVYYFKMDYRRNAFSIMQKSVAMRMYFPQEIQLLFEHTGLEIVEAWGGYDKSPLTKKSEKQIYFLRKKL